MGDDDFLSRSESEVEQAVTIFPRTFEPLDAAPAIQRRIRKPFARFRSDVWMKTIIIFNNHMPTMPQKAA